VYRRGGRLGRLFVTDFSFVDIVNQLLLFVLLVILYGHENLAFAGLHHDRLIVETTDHVERALRFTAQGQFQDIVRDPAFDDPA
jgi:hypothetical protein